MEYLRPKRIKGMPIALLGAVLLTVTASCTLTRTERGDCTSNDACQAVFGYGHVCSSDSGLCERAPVNPRCTRTYPKDLFSRPDLADMFVIGSVIDQSNPLFLVWENALEVAFVGASEAGLRKGDDLGIVFCTNEVASQDGATDYGDGFESNGDAGVAMANYLVDEIGVPAIFGPVRSGTATRLINEVVIPKEVLVISPSATSAQLTTLDPAPGLFWRTTASDAEQGSAIAYDMHKGLGRAAPVNKVAVVNVDDSYGNGLADIFEDAFKAKGGTVVIREFFPVGDKDTRDTFIRDAGEADVDEVLFVTSDQGDIIEFKNLTASLASYNDKGIFFTEVASNSEALSGGASDRVPQVRASRPSLSPGDPAIYDGFVQRYSMAFGTEVQDDEVFSANAYDAGWLLIYGLAWAELRKNEVNGANMAEGLRQISDLNGVKFDIGAPDWINVRKSLATGETINIVGASGDLDFQMNEELQGSVDIWIPDPETETAKTQYVWNPGDE